MTDDSQELGCLLAVLAAVVLLVVVYAGGA